MGFGGTTAFRGIPLSQHDQDDRSDVPGKPGGKGPLVAAGMFLPAVIVLLIGLAVILFVVF